MHNNNSLKRLLAVTAVAAMFSAFGVHAQTSTGSSSTGSTSASGQATTQTGKTTSEGTKGNTESRGTEEKMGSQGTMQGSSGSQSTTQGTSGNQGMSGVSDTTGTGASARQTGKTTSEGTVGNTNSTGMEKRQGKDQGMSGSKGTSGTSGSQGTSGGGTAAAGKSELDKADEKMLKAMARANIAEIEAGKLAQSKSQNDQVKSFAQQMIDDHTKALNDVQAVAQQKGVTLPTEPDAKHKAMATKLESLSGDAFDKEYMAKAGVSDHKAVHSALMRDEKKAKDADVKALASKMTPVVEQHLKSAEQMKSAKSGTTSGK